METVKGGGLIKLADEAKAVLDALERGELCRLCYSLLCFLMVLSGMGDLDMDVSYMKDFVPFSQKVYRAIEKVREILKHQDTIACTARRYCVDGCPKKKLIPDLFACFNAKKQFQDGNADFYYQNLHTKTNGKASDCMKCGKCEQNQA